MPSSIRESDTESEGASVAPSEASSRGARAKPALERDRSVALARALRGVGRFARRKPLGALGAACLPSRYGLPPPSCRPPPAPGLLTRVVPPPSPAPATTPRVTRGPAIGVPQATSGGAARALGGGPARITARHILPNVMATI